MEYDSPRSMCCMCVHLSVLCSYFMYSSNLVRLAVNEQILLQISGRLANQNTVTICGQAPNVSSMFFWSWPCGGAFSSSSRPLRPLRASSPSSGVCGLWMESWCSSYAACGSSAASGSCVASGSFEASGSFDSFAASGSLVASCSSGCTLTAWTQGRDCYSS